MLDSILETISQLKIFVIVSGIGILIVGLLLLILCNKFSWNSWRRKIIGFFYRMGTWDALGLSCCFIKVFLVISFFVSMGRVELIHIFIFVLLKLCYLINKRTAKGLVMDIGLTIISVIVMIIMGLLYNYLNDIIFDVKISAIMWLLGVLLCLYSVYDLFSCCNNIIKRRKVNDVQA